MNAADPVRGLRRHLERSRRIVGFTGAGISTESGIPDYRSQGGIWSRYRPVYYEEFLRDPDKRREYWERTLAMWPAFRDAKPNRGHAFFVDLHRSGKLKGLITQNVDGLHERSGLPAQMIVNLHGTSLRCVCLTCGQSMPSEVVARTADLDQGVPMCSCGGLLKPDTVSFGQPLRTEDLARAHELARSCDLLLAMGSTLQVQPAAGIPVTAKRAGALLAIVTLSETPLDGMADVVVNLPIGELVERLGRTE